MEFWKMLPLLAVILGPLFYLLHRFGFMVVKSGTFFGSAMGTPTRFRGEYRHLCGSVSKRFRIAGKYAALSLQLEAASGSAKVEVLGPNKAVLYSWNFCSSLSERIDCGGMGSCTVRVASEDFAGKFSITLE